MSIEEKIIEQYKNKGGFTLQVVAQLAGPGLSNVLYIIRVIDPRRGSVDFITDLEGFSKLGELLNALSIFAKLKIVANEKEAPRLKELLTADNIKQFAEILKKSKSS